MSGAVTGAVLGAIGGGGLLLVVLGLPLRRRPALDDRVLPYLAGLQRSPGVDDWRLSAGQGRRGTARAVFGPSLRNLADLVGRVVGDSREVQRRLVRAGSPLTVEEFRVEQVTWGLLAAAGTAAVALLGALRGTVAPAALLIAVGFAFVAGILARDQRLSHTVRERERAMLAEFPAIADLLALAVAAGEGPVPALERVVRIASGPLADDIRSLLGEVATGTPVASALDHLAARTGVSAVARFASTLAVALQRGTPLVEVLHAQAADVREVGRRGLLEAGARKEVLMMVPVVFLVLPVTVVFAFFPGVVGLQLTTP